jgi:hypothetical protein
MMGVARECDNASLPKSGGDVDAEMAGVGADLSNKPLFLAVTSVLSFC